MTYKEYFLNKEVSIDEFINFLKSKQPNNKFDITFDDIKYHLKGQAKPVLTEDERVILRNIDLVNFKAIGRKEGYLYLRYTDYTIDYGETDIQTLTFWYMYHDLFKFIKNGEEYLIEELLDEKV